MAWLYVPELEDLNSDSALQSLLSEPSVLWRGKPMLLQFWQRAWGKGGWIRLLFGMTLPPSTLARGVERWISSLEDTRVSRSLSPENARGPAILATSGLTSPASSVSANPHKCSWRTL